MTSALIRTVGRRSPDRARKTRFLSSLVVVGALVAIGCTPPDAEAALPKVVCEQITEPARESARGITGQIQDAFAPVDSFFGRMFVGPLASILFFDLIFWDDAITDADVERAVGKVMRGQEYVSFDAEKRVFLTQRRYRAWASKTELIAADPNTADAAPSHARTVGQRVKMGDEHCVRIDEAVVVGVPSPERVDLRSTTVNETAANPFNRSLPFIVLWLVLGALYFTIKMAFVNIRAFPHALKVVVGKYDHPDDKGEISHFQALSSALSATVGLGNIAGVAIAVSVGGPGAVFWMMFAGFLGMSSKFVECTLGLMYRHVDGFGVVLGGPMRYLRDGLEEKGMSGLGRVLSVIFMLMCIGGSFGGGNMFQANQAFAAVVDRFPGMADYGWLFGIVLAILVGLVIIGGIRRIGAAASLLVPIMCGIYLVAGSFIILVNIEHLGWAFGVILSEAFTPTAGMGGLLGVLVTGFQRAAFSNEAGVGSASIAHSAATTNEPVREGIVALLEPFIDTIVVCTMTGVIVVITGVYELPGVNGVVMTSYAFSQAIPWFPWILTITVILFAFSTQISWSYYGERCWTMLFGAKTSMIYRVLFLFFVFFGTVFKLGNVLDFSDLMVLGMAFPNVLGAVILSGKVKAALVDYMARLKSGAMQEHKPEKST